VVPPPGPVVVAATPAGADSNTGFAPPEPTPAPDPEPVTPALPAPLAWVAPMPREAPEDPLPPGEAPHFVVDLNYPDGHMTFPSSTFYKPGMRIVLRGRVRTLTIGSLEGGSVDASQLVVTEKVGINKVDHAVVKVNAPGCEVNLASAITNGSDVTVLAPMGEVNFKTAWGSTVKAPRIEGGSHVVVHAKKVVVGGPITGDASHVAVTLDTGGQFKAHSVVGAAVVEYRKAKPGDPPPHVEIGEADPRAVIRRAE
jgi:hypothetical protein